MPLTLVLVGLNGRRMLAGAFGLRSQVSRWPGEPTRKRAMQFLTSAFASSTAPAAFMRRKSGRFRPTSPAAPAWRKLRRVGPPQVGTLTFPICNMAIPPFKSPTREQGLSVGSNGVADLVGNLDELAVILGREPLVFPDLQHDLVGAGRLVGVLVGSFGAGGHRRQRLAVARDLPLQPAGPVVADLRADHLAPLQLERRLRRAFKHLVHESCTPECGQLAPRVEHTQRLNKKSFVLSSVHMRSCAASLRLPS